MSDIPCFISDMRSCKARQVKDLVFIIGSGSREFKDDIEAINEILNGFGFSGYFALLSEKEKGLDSFCDKICSKILGSEFYVVMLNDPITPKEQYPDSAKKGVVLRTARPNVYYEFGIAVAADKNIIPVMRRNMTLPFDVQHLDVLLYNGLDELRHKLIVAVRETLRKPQKKSVVKEPKLELLLIDSEGNMGMAIDVKPKYFKVKSETGEEIISDFYEPSEFETISLGVLRPKAPSKGLVPIGIYISNNGEVPAAEINIFLDFPPECQLFSKDDFEIPLVIQNRTSWGLNVDRKHRTKARAWIKNLGNDLCIDTFDKIYVRFPPEEQQHKIKARVTQNNYPPKDFEFFISVKPVFKEKIE